MRRRTVLRVEGAIDVVENTSESQEGYCCDEYQF